MKIRKEKLNDLKRCYCASSVMVDGTKYAIAASEDPGYQCYAYSTKDFNDRQLVWDGPGGCMSVIPFEDRENEFLAVQEFYLKVSPSLSKLVWGKHTENGWQLKDVLLLQYLHRFDIYNVDGINWFIGATIAETKTCKDDWTVPGKIYVGKIPNNLSEGIELEVLQDGLFKNHGYTKVNENGNIYGLFGCDSGIYKCTPPSGDNGWTCEKVLDGHISEIASCDLDGDGINELMTIEPFHGNAIKIYKYENDQYKEVYSYPSEIDFAHSLVATTLRGVPTFVAGVRRVDAELFYVQYVNGQYVPTIIEKGVGPANVHVINDRDRDLIISANHTANEAAVYICED